jgi:predicted HAD superfamily Cof-like phosphohydrolase
MKEPTGLNSVAEFHHLFDLPVLDEPQIPAKERCKLRLSLLKEELEELEEAIEDHDLVEVADAFCDLQYVLSGAILEFGLGEKISQLFDEVHRSNMSKACATMEEAEDTSAHYKRTKDTDSEIRPKDGKFLVYRKGDGKVLKSIKYSAARIKEMLGL